MNLASLELRILELHNSLDVRTTVDQAVEIGKLLLVAKEAVGHGRYGQWLDRIGIQRRTAGIYTQCAFASKAQRAAHSSLASLLNLIRQGRKLERQRAREQLAATAAPHQARGLLCQDSMTWLKKQPTGSVPFFLSDPPYGLAQTFGDWTEAGSAEAHWKWFQPYWLEMQRVVQPGGSIILWQAYQYLEYLKAWFDSPKIIAMCYVLRGLRQWEPVIKWTKGGATPLVPDHGFNDWIIASQDKRRTEFEAKHPCPKPVSECRELVRRFTTEGSLVVDLFCGIASIPIACKLENRHFFGIDRNREYIKVAKARLAQS